MRRDKEELIVVEFNAGPGSGLRRKLKSLGAVKRNTVLALALAGYALLIWACLLMPQTALVSVPLVACLVASVLFACPRDEILVSKHGLSFPSTLSLHLQQARVRMWTELDKVEVLTPQSHPLETHRLKASALRLQFQSGAQVVLPLSSFSAESLELFVAAIEKWSQDCNDARLLHVPQLFRLEQSSTSLDDGSYTRFWEEQLANNYSFSSFVPLAPHQKLQDGRITVAKELACGGFSAIYLVRHEDGRELVLKESVIPPDVDLSVRQKVRAQFEREAAILIRLHHERIARVFDHFVEGGRNYLLLEHIDGADLKELVRLNGAQKESTVLDWLAQAAAILSYLHEQQPPIIHRDIAPDNLVLTPSGKIVLIDFGAANEFVGTATGTLIGKQCYMAPEQIRGKAVPQSDIYSLGATAYYLLTGRDPEPLGVDSVQSCRPEVSTASDQLIRDMTRLDASLRLASAQEASARLAELREPAGRTKARAD
jgi:tRNA A-37 threonylcarbamoyl transferase component Bud32